MPRSRSSSAGSMAKRASYQQRGSIPIFEDVGIPQKPLMLWLMRRALLLPILFVVLAGIGLTPTRAQVRPIYDRGAGGLTLALERLQTTASALHTGAHPDDEDSA